jgi:hypothetical protein
MIINMMLIIFFYYFIHKTFWIWKGKRNAPVSIYGSGAFLLPHQCTQLFIPSWQEYPYVTKDTAFCRRYWCSKNSSSSSFSLHPALPPFILHHDKNSNFPYISTSCCMHHFYSNHDHLNSKKTVQSFSSPSISLKWLNSHKPSIWKILQI